MHGEFAGKITTLGVLDHVDLADEVGDRHVGRRELFLVAFVAADPGDRRCVSLDGQAITRLTRDRVERVVVHFRPGDDRNRVVEQMNKLTKHPGFGLAAKAEEEHVVTREDGVLNLRNDGFLVAEDIGKECLLSANLGDKVPPHFVLDRLDTVAACLEFAERSRPIQSHRRRLPEVAVMREGR